MTDATALFDGLPRPGADRLVLYVFGPGVGESQVIAFPDGKWMVVDSCKIEHEATLPLELLRYFGAGAVDLLVATHSDRDHLRGMDEIVANLPVGKLWRFRGYHSRREALAQICAHNPGNRQLEDLRQALEAMRPLLAINRGAEADINTMPWPRGGNAPPYQVTCLSPCPADLAHEAQQIDKLWEFAKNKVEIKQEVMKFILGESRSIDGGGNPLSLSLSITWNGFRILLGGDVEHSASDPHRGWRGVLQVLEEDARLDLVQDIDVIKVSHHGSKGAYCPEAWLHHCRTSRVAVAIVTPYRSGRNPPPHAETMRSLRAHANMLALTSSPETSDAAVTSPTASSCKRIIDAGWVRVDVPSGPGSAACVAVTLCTSQQFPIATSQQGAVFE